MDMLTWTRPDDESVGSGAFRPGWVQLRWGHQLPHVPPVTPQAGQAGAHGICHPGREGGV